MGLVPAVGRSHEEHLLKRGRYLGRIQYIPSTSHKNSVPVENKLVELTGQLRQLLLLLMDTQVASLPTPNPLSTHSHQLPDPHMSLLRRRETQQEKRVIHSGWAAERLSPRR